MVLLDVAGEMLLPVMVEATAEDGVPGISVLSRTISVLLCVPWNSISP